MIHNRLQNIGTKDFTKEYRGVWVFGEQRYAKEEPVVLELLGKGREIADQLQVELSVILIGNHLDTLSQKLIAYGADKVYLIQHTCLENFNDLVYTDIICELVQEYKPEILLLGATTYGRSIAPRVASRLNTGLTADCIQLEIDLGNRLLLQTRPTFGGNLLATITCVHARPQMATVRPKIMHSLEPNYSRKGEVIQVKCFKNKIPKIRIKEVIRSSNQLSNLSEADIIIGIGRGIGSFENINLVKKLAELLGGAIGATRDVVELGWLSHEHQIGQTGKVVCPKIYIACGISGSVQHLAGVSASESIISINNDLEAPILKVAKWAIVGDLMKILPALIDKLSARRA